VRVEDARRSRGHLLERRNARLRLEVPSRGLRLKLAGADRDTLHLLGRDLAAHLADAPASREVARTYGLSGVVRDPRTGAAHKSIKEVVGRGKLEVFLRAWSESR
jgi:hypothetical protein